MCIIQIMLKSIQFMPRNAILKLQQYSSVGLCIIQEPTNVGSIAEYNLMHFSVS